MDTLNRAIYCFWVGKNNLNMSSNRLASLNSLVENSGVEVRLIDNNNLHNYILDGHPLHEGYEYLSDVHKADYLRTYFMNFYGGGYSDIKPCNWDWNPYFDSLVNSEFYGIGAPEDEFELSVTPKIRPWIGKYWKRLMTNDLYIFKSNTPFTNAWYNTLIHLMDSKLELLVAHPAENEREAADTMVTRYPIEWGEILLEVFHPLCFLFSEKLLIEMPVPITTNYR